MGRFTGKTCRLLSMLIITIAFFLVEISVGYVTNSMALVADSFHMLSDIIALLIAFVSVRFSRRKSSKNTFGWARAEVLGALVNAVFLVALCFSIFVEACKRLNEWEEVHSPQLILIVGVIGFIINAIGLGLFHGHAHGPGHSHSHGHPLDDIDETEDLVKDMEKYSNGSIPVPRHEIVNRVIEERQSPKIVQSSQLNMRGVFLHVLGDAMGSIIVIISAAIIWKSNWEHKYYVDPALSILMVSIIMSTTIPLLKESALILLQTVPTHIQITDIQNRLIKQIDGVLAVHEFHVWQLAGNRIIASAHIRCRNLKDYMKIAERVKEFFHNEGIHSTTIQPEFIEYQEDMTMADCILDCPPDKNCSESTCCGVKKDALRIPSSPSQSSCRQRVTSSGNSGESSHVCEDSEDKAVSESIV